MRNIVIAERGIERAGRWLRTAEEAFAGKRWDDAIYVAQMSVEQSSKAVLFALGVDFPLEHDVSAIFRTLTDRDDLPSEFKKSVPKVCHAIRELAKRRGQAGYGFEDGITVNYFEDYAPEALRLAKEVHSVCKKFLRKVFKTMKIKLK